MGLLNKLVCSSIWKNNGRFKSPCFLHFHHGVCHNDDDITRLSLSCSSTVQTNNSCSAFPGNNISFETFAVVIVDILLATEIQLAAVDRQSAAVVNKDLAADLKTSG